MLFLTGFRAVCAAHRLSSPIPTTRPFWNHNIISALRDENGKITHYVGVQQEVRQPAEATRRGGAIIGGLSLSGSGKRSGLGGVAAAAAAGSLGGDQLNIGLDFDGDLA